MESVIKSISSYRAINIGDLEEEEIRSHDYLYQTSRFDEKGNLLEEVTYTPEGVVGHKSVYGYDEKGRMVEEILVEEDEIVSEHRTLEYDEEGRIATEKLHYLDGSYDETSYHYDSEGRLTGKDTLSSEGEGGNKVFFEYEGKHVLSEKEFDAEGEEISSRINRYDTEGNLLEEEVSGFEEEYLAVNEYDSSGHRVLAKKYDSGGHLVERYTYTRDATGNITEIKEETTAGIELIRMDYDNRGNTIEQVTTVESGELVSRIIRMYNVANQLERTEVLIEGKGQRMPQHYRIRFEYESY